MRTGCGGIFVVSGIQVTRYENVPDDTSPKLDGSEGVYTRVEVLYCISMTKQYDIL